MTDHNSFEYADMLSATGQRLCGTWSVTVPAGSFVGMSDVDIIARVSAPHWFDGFDMSIEINTVISENGQTTFVFDALSDH